MHAARVKYCYSCRVLINFNLLGTVSKKLVTAHPHTRTHSQLYWAPIGKVLQGDLDTCRVLDIGEWRRAPTKSSAKR